MAAAKQVPVVSPAIVNALFRLIQNKESIDSPSTLIVGKIKHPKLRDDFVAVKAHDFNSAKNDLFREYLAGASASADGTTQ